MLIYEKKCVSNQCYCPDSYISHIQYKSVQAKYPIKKRYGFHINFTAISQKLKAGELKAKNSPEINKSVQILKLLKNALQKIKQECQNDSLLYFELTNPNNQLAVELNTELKDGLISIINSKE